MSPRLATFPQRSPIRTKRSGRRSCTKSSSLLTRIEEVASAMRRDGRVGERRSGQVVYMNGFVALLDQPPAEAARQLRIDDELHSAAEAVIGWSVVRAA